MRLEKFIPNVMFNAINYRFIIYDWQFAILVSKYINLVSMRMNIILYRYEDDDEPPLLPMKKNKNEQVFLP